MSWFWGSLILPAYAAVVWRSGREGKKRLRKVWRVWASAVVWRAVPGSGFVAAVFTLIGAVLLLAAVGKGWFGKEVRSLTMRAGIALAAVFLLVCAVSYGSAYLEQQTGYQAWKRAECIRNILRGSKRGYEKELALSDREGEDLTGTELEWSRFDARSTFLWMYMLRYLGSLPVIVLTLLVERSDTAYQNGPGTAKPAGLSAGAGGRAVPFCAGSMVYRNECRHFSGDRSLHALLYPGRCQPVRDLFS